VYTTVRREVYPGVYALPVHGGILHPAVYASLYYPGYTTLPCYTTDVMYEAGISAERRGPGLSPGITHGWEG